MQQDPSSIFDENILDEIYVRRIKLLSLPLKILVWFFLLNGLYSFTRWPFFFTLLQSPLNVNPGVVLLMFGLVISGLFWVSSVLILLERKYAVLFALIVLGISELITAGNLVINVSAVNMPVITMVVAVFFFFLKIVYIILLLKIRSAWEGSAIPGNQAGSGN